MAKEAKEEPKVEPQPVEEVKLEVEKDVIEVVPEEEAVPHAKATFDLASWTPKSVLGTQVKQGLVTDIDFILENGKKIVEPQIVEILIPNLEADLLMIGQSKGKFGGGARRVFKQTQKKTPEGNKPSFACMAVAGNRNGYVGIGYGKSKDTVPAREKAARNAKLNVFKIKRGCGSWQCSCKTPHSLPFAVDGKCGSVTIKLLPAPKGKGLVVEKELQKVLALAGFKDVWCKSAGQTRVKNNLVMACVDALRKLSTTKINQESAEAVGLLDGRAQ